jgi:peptidoglycan/LPS O-acetylase OafA/YrhL
LYFGTISYGVYLWHVIVRDRIVSTSWFHDIGPNFWVLLGATLVMSVIVATASYYLVEKPLLRFKDPRSRGRAGPARRARVPEAVPVGSPRS